MLIYSHDLKIEHPKGFFSISNGWIIWATREIIKITVDGPPEILSDHRHSYLTESHDKRCIVEKTKVRYFFHNGKLSEPVDYYYNRTNPPSNLDDYIDVNTKEREFSSHVPHPAFTEDKLIRKLTGIKNSYIIISNDKDLMSFELPTKEFVYFTNVSPDGLLVIVMTQKEFILIDNPLKQ